MVFTLECLLVGLVLRFSEDRQLAIENTNVVLVETAMSEKMFVVVAELVVWQSVFL